MHLSSQRQTMQEVRMNIKESGQKDKNHHNIIGLFTGQHKKKKKKN